MTSSWSQNDELFFSELKQGHAWQNLPATFFKLHDLKVEIPDLSIRDNISEAGKWLNTVDLIVNGFELEIKSRNERFTSPKNFPYPTFFVDTVSGYDGKIKKPFAYIMVSRFTGSMLWLSTETHDKWNVVSKFDRTRKIHEDFYEVDKKYLKTMDAFLKRLRNEL